MFMCRTPRTNRRHASVICWSFADNNTIYLFIFIYMLLVSNRNGKFIVSSLESLKLSKRKKGIQLEPESRARLCKFYEYVFFRIDFCVECLPSQRQLSALFLGIEIVRLFNYSKTFSFKFSSLAELLLAIFEFSLQLSHKFCKLCIQYGHLGKSSKTTGKKIFQHCLCRI